MAATPEPPSPQPQERRGRLAPSPPTWEGAAAAGGAARGAARPRPAGRPVSGCGTRRATGRAPAALAPVLAPPPPPTSVEQTPHSTAPLARGWGRGAPARSGAATRGAPRTAPVSAGREGHRAAAPAEQGSRQPARSLRRAPHRLCLWPVLAKCLRSPHLRRFAGAFIGVAPCKPGLRGGQSQDADTGGVVSRPAPVPGAKRGRRSAQSSGEVPGRTGLAHPAPGPSPQRSLPWSRCRAPGHAPTPASRE